MPTLASFLLYLDAHTTRTKHGPIEDRYEFSPGISVYVMRQHNKQRIRVSGYPAGTGRVQHLLGKPDEFSVADHPIWYFT